MFRKKAYTKVFPSLWLWKNVYTAKDTRNRLATYILKYVGKPSFTLLPKAYSLSLKVNLVWNPITGRLAFEVVTYRLIKQ
jgi:hypothetical protein